MHIGKEVEVLFEEKKNGYYQGHTNNYILALCKTDLNLENKLIKVKCEQNGKDHLIVKCN